MDFIFLYENFILDKIVDYISLRNYYMISETSKVMNKFIKEKIYNEHRKKCYNPLYWEISESFELLKWSICHSSFKITEDLLRMVGKENDFEMFKYIFTKFNFKENDTKGLVFHQIACHGKIEYVKFLFDKEIILEEQERIMIKLYEGSADGGYLDIIKYLDNKFNNMDKYIENILLNASFTYDSMEVIEYIMEKYEYNIPINILIEMLETSIYEDNEMLEDYLYLHEPLITKRDDWNNYLFEINTYRSNILEMVE